MHLKNYKKSSFYNISFNEGIELNQIEITASKKIEEIDAVACTAGPGLIVCLSVGLSFAKTFA